MYSNIVLVPDHPFLPKLFFLIRFGDNPRHPALMAYDWLHHHLWVSSGPHHHVTTFSLVLCFACSGPKVVSSLKRTMSLGRLARRWNPKEKSFKDEFGSSSSLQNERLR